MKTDLKTLRPYKVRWQDDSGKFIKFQDVKGYRVIFRGFQAFEFFVHHPAIGERENHHSLWRVTEVNTGCSVGKDGGTRQVAINSANESLLRHGLREFNTVYKKFKERVSLSNKGTRRR